MIHDIEELPIPERVFAAEQQAEIARIWLADGDQVVTISPRLWEDPGVWGLMLVDMARHVAQAYAVQGVPSDYAFQKICEAWDAERSHPTDIE